MAATILFILRLENDDWSVTLEIPTDYTIHRLILELIDYTELDYTNKKKGDTEGKLVRYYLKRGTDLLPPHTNFGDPALAIRRGESLYLVPEVTNNTVYIPSPDATEFTPYAQDYWQISRKAFASGNLEQSVAILIRKFVNYKSIIDNLSEQTKNFGSKNYQANKKTNRVQDEAKQKFIEADLPRLEEAIEVLFKSLIESQKKAAFPTPLRELLEKSEVKQYLDYQNSANLDPQENLAIIMVEGLLNASHLCAKQPGTPKEQIKHLQNAYEVACLADLIELTKEAEKAQKLSSMYLKMLELPFDKLEDKLKLAEEIKGLEASYGNIETQEKEYRQEKIRRNRGLKSTRTV